MSYKRISGVRNKHLVLKKQLISRHILLLVRRHAKAPMLTFSDDLSDKQGGRGAPGRGAKEEVRLREDSGASVSRGCVLLSPRAAR